MHHVPQVILVTWPKPHCNVTKINDQHRKEVQRPLHGSPHLHHPHHSLVSHMVSRQSSFLTCETLKLYCPVHQSIMWWSHTSAIYVTPGEGAGGGRGGG